MSLDANPPAATAPQSRRGLYILGVAGLLIAAVVVVFGITTRKVADAKLQEWTEAQAIPVVAVAPPDTRGKTTTFSIYATTVYRRTGDGWRFVFHQQTPL